MNEHYYVILRFFYVNGGLETNHCTVNFQRNGHTIPQINYVHN